MYMNKIVNFHNEAKSFFKSSLYCAKKSMNAFKNRRLQMSKVGFELFELMNQTELQNEP